MQQTNPDNQISVKRVARVAKVVAVVVEENPCQVEVLVVIILLVKVSGNIMKKTMIPINSR